MVVFSLIADSQRVVAARTLASACENSRGQLHRASHDPIRQTKDRDPNGVPATRGRGERLSQGPDPGGRPGLGDPITNLLLHCGPVLHGFYALPLAPA